MERKVLLSFVLGLVVVGVPLAYILGKQGSEVGSETLQYPSQPPTEPETFVSPEPYVAKAWALLFEVELETSEDVGKLRDEDDVEVVGNVESTMRCDLSGEWKLGMKYLSSGPAWVNGVRRDNWPYDSDFSDRFIVRVFSKDNPLEKGIELSERAYIEWLAIALRLTEYDGQVVP